MSVISTVANATGLSGADAKEQACELTGLVKAKLDSPESAQKFIELRYCSRLSTHLRMGPGYSSLSTTLNIISITAGAAASSLAAADQTQKWPIFILGLLVAAASAINQIGRFGQRAAIRVRAANSLRREGWNFVTERGRYKGLDYANPETFGVFYDAVWEIEEPADAIAEQSFQGDAKG